MSAPAEHPRPQAPARIRVQPVVTRTDRRDFLELPGRIHRAAGTAGQYVPLQRADVRAWLRGRGWFPEPVTCLLAREEPGGQAGDPTHASVRTRGRAVGRIIVHRSDAFDAKLDARVQLFGALEAESPRALRALLEAARAHGSAEGRELLFGPASPLPNVTGGVVTSGCEHPGFFDTTWNPEFFAPVLEEAGFSPWGPAHTWEVPVAGIPPALRRTPTPFELDRAGVRLLRPSRRPGWLAETLRAPLNASFARLPYFTPIDRAQMAAQTAGAELLMDPALVVVAADARRSGSRADAAQVHCFVLVLPDPVDVLRAHDGRLGPRAAWALLHSRRTAGRGRADLSAAHSPEAEAAPGRADPAATPGRTAVLIIQGTDPAQQGRGLLSLCIRRLYAQLHAHGYTHLRVTFVAEDNPGSAAVLSRAGGRRLHGLSFFTAPLAETGSSRGGAR